MKMGIASRASVVAIALLGLIGLAAAQQLAEVKVVDFPRRPESQCDTESVRTAILVCALEGAKGPTCCTGLEAVFANKTSPSYGCLCLPPVLYQVITKAAQAGSLDVLGVLQQCRDTRPSFIVQWATALPTGCPELPDPINAVSLAPLLGSAPLLNPDAGSIWSWGNMQQFTELMSWKPHVYEVMDDVFGVRLVQIILAVFAALPLLFAAICGALRRFSAVYRDLPQHQQLITCQHMTYAVLFGLSMAPQTYLALRVLFAPASAELVAANVLTLLLGVFTVPRFALYLLEAANRTVVKPNAAVVATRIGAVASGVAVVISKNVAVLGLALVVDLWAVYEAPLYLTLVSRTLCWPVKFTRPLLRGSCVLYALTRVLQIVMLVYMIVTAAAVPAVSRTPEFIIVAIAALAYSLASFWTLVVYKRMDLKLSARSLCGPPVAAAPAAAASFGGSRSAGSNRAAGAGKGVGAGLPATHIRAASDESGSV